MQNFKEQIKKFIDEAERILKIIPDKSKYSASQRKIGEKCGNNSEHYNNQLRIIIKEFEMRQKNALSRYNFWFSNAAKLLEGLNDLNSIKKLKETKSNLMLDDRLKAGIEVLESIIHNKNFKKTNWREILLNGESDVAEFKSSLRWDYRTRQLNKYLEIAVAKTICAFMNSNGGSLFIGVNDKGSVVGIENDYKFLMKQNADGFVLFLVQVINNRIGKEFNKYVSAVVEKIDGKDVCIVRVEASEKPSFLKYDNKEEFYIRASVSSEPLNVREANEYINMRWR